MKRLIRELSVILCLIVICFFCFAKTKKLESAASTNVKDTLSTSQLSYFARLDAGTSGNIISVSLTSGTAPSNNTYNLFVGDTIAIGVTSADLTGAPLTIYTVRDIGNTAAIQLNQSIGATNNFAGAAVIATRSAVHTVSFTPKSTSPGNKWQFLIKATSTAGKEMDGIPDQDGFDLGQDVGSTVVGSGTRVNLADITCPFGVSATATGTTAVIITNGSTTSSFHIIECALSAGVTNPIDVGVSLVIGSTSSQLINPSASTTHTVGQANSSGDTYLFYVRHTDSAGVVYNADTTAGRIALVEAVRVTATVDPTITFAIGTSGVLSAGTSVCGVGTSLSTGAPNTTAATVNFGSLNLSVFNILAQHLSCVTNADNGYAVTVFEENVMKNINTATTIPDTNCGPGSCTVSVGATWSTVDTARSEWGYSIRNISANTAALAPPNYKPFGIGSSSAQTIISNSNTPTSTETAWVCYQLSVTNTQEAGNYEAKLVYTATATF